MPLDQERDLGEFGGDETRESEGESGDTDEEDKTQKKHSKRQRRAADRNTTLLLIVC